METGDSIKKKGPRFGVLQMMGFNMEALSFVNMHEFSQATSILKIDNSRYLGKQCIVTANTHIFARLKLGSPLSHNNGSAMNQLPGKTLHSKPLSIAISSVPGTSDTLFMCHTCLLTYHTDFFYANCRVLLAMSTCAAILLFLFIFENKDFVVLPLHFQHAPHRGAFHPGLSDVSLFLSLDQKHVFELDWGTQLGIKPFHMDNVPLRYAVLLSAAHNNCIHGLTSKAK